MGCKGGIVVPPRAHPEGGDRGHHQRLDGSLPTHGLVHHELEGEVEQGNQEGAQRGACGGQGGGWEVSGQAGETDVLAAVLHTTLMSRCML